MRILVLLALLLSACSSRGTTSAPAEPEVLKPVDLVDPFIGTLRARWSFFAPAALPFGMVKLAPDTNGFGGYGGGGNIVGYSYADTSIIGFSLIHEWQLGAFLFMPATGQLVTTPGTDPLASGFRSSFRKETESARPGYYSVFLDKHGVKVELTATTRAAVQRYTYPQGTSSHVLIDVGHLLGEAGLAGKSVTDAWIGIDGPRSLTAAVTFQPPYGTKPVSIYLAATFSKPFATSGTYRDADAYPGATTISGPGSGFFATFSTGPNESITVAAGVSFVSAAQARLNLETEVGTKTFDQVVEAATVAWNDELGKVEVSGGRPEDLTKLYTALWHVLLGRGIAEDVDGAYLDSMGRVRHIPFENGALAFNRFNSDSLWGSYWTLSQVWSLLYPRRMESFVRFMLSVYEDSGWIPDGYLPGQYAAGMPANHATSFVANAMMKGLRFDHRLAFDAIRKNQDETAERPPGAGNEVLGPYLQYGFAPYQAAGYGPTAHTLEYAYEDWCASEIATKVGASADAARWLARSRSYQNVFHPDHRMFWPRSVDGSWLVADWFSPMSGFTFAEGNAWQYLWSVPQDIPALIGMMGEDLFLARLLEVMSEADARSFSAGDQNTSGYWALRFNPGNETDLHVPWLFNLVQRPDMTGHYTRRIMNTFFGTTPESGYGIGQDDDQGQLGAWFVLMAIGLFDVQGGCGTDAQMQLSAPLFDRVKLHLDPDYYPGGAFSITVQRSSSEAVRIDAARVNGVDLPGVSIPQRTVVGGGELLLDVN